MIFAEILFGLIIGSFLSVCVFRIPYGREKGPPRWDEAEADVVETEDSATASTNSETPRLTISDPPRSICPQCKTQLLWYHNIPVLSWLMLKGRCAFCNVPISMRYPLTELLTALFCVLSFHLYGLSLTALLVFLFCCALLVISLIDIDYYIIPDVISLPGTVLGLVLAAVNHFVPGTFHWPMVQSLWSSLLGVLVGGGTLLVISELYFRLRNRIGLGMGDVKLLAMTGAFFGAEGAIYSMFVGSLAGSVFGVLFILLFGKKLTHQLPFGPYLAFGTILYLFASRNVGGFAGLFQF